MNIVMVTFELAPIAKVGGLADVAAALSRELARRGHAVRVVLPAYGHLELAAAGLEPVPGLPVLPLRAGQRVQPVRLLRSESLLDGVEVFAVDCPPLFRRPGIYGSPDGRDFADSLERASVVAQAALVLPLVLQWPVDVLHCHDVQGGLAAVYRRRWHGPDLPGRGGTLLTIHNLAHQELRPPDGMSALDLPQELAQWPGPFEFHGSMNTLKGAILHADLVNTVSPSYAREVVGDPAHGHGLDGVLASRGEDFSGILNGADYATWSPANDPLLPARYDSDDLAGREACRVALTRELGLDPGTMVVGMVTRLYSQKGVDLVLTACDRMVAEGMSLVVLGSGDAVMEAGLRRAAERHPRRVAFSPRFDEPLAHRIYAGADVFLMPSAFEPCGLSQMYAMRYGTPPVVRATGGLRDTVVDASEPEGTGFVFWDQSADAMLAALQRARVMREDAKAWEALVRRGMAQRFDWSRAADRYEELYGRLATR
ncbi:MAG: glycogen/starch synthase [Candidatus Krumholzibacteriia bacterium]